MGDRVRQAWGYGRVSTDNQLSGLETQQAQVEGYYQYLLKPQGVGYAGWFADEDTSGRIPLRERDRGFHVITNIASGDHLVVAKLDRAFRNALDCLQVVDQCRRRGITIHILDLGVNTESPLGHLVIGIMALFAQWERQRLSERIKETNVTRRGKGLACSGKAPYGFTVTNAKRPPGGGRAIVPAKLVPNEFEWRVMKAIHSMQENGEALDLIKKKLEARQIFNRKGKPWQLSSIHRMGKRYAKALGEGTVPFDLSAEST